MIILFGKRINNPILNSFINLNFHIHNLLKIKNPKLISGFYLFIIFLFSLHNCKADNVFGSEFYYFKIDLTSIKNDEVAVILYTPNILKDETQLIFDKKAIVKNLETTDIRGKKEKIKNGKNNHYPLTNASKIVKITYTVSLLETEHMQSKNLLTLYNNSYLCKIEDCTDDIFRIDFQVEKNWNAYTQESLLKEDNVFTIRTQDITTLQSIPILFGNIDTASTYIANQKYQFYLIENDAKSNAHKIANIYHDELHELYKSQSDTSSQPIKNIYFHCQEMDSLYEIINQSSSLEIIKINRAKTDLAIQQLLAYKKENLLKEQISSSINIEKKSSQYWLLEGMHSYLRMKNDMMKSQSAKDYFYLWIENHYQKSLLYPDTIAVTKTNGSKTISPAYSENKAPLFVLALDIEIRKLTQNKSSIEDLLPYFKKKYHSQLIPEDVVIYDIVRCYNNTKLADFLWRYVDGHDSLPTLKYLQDLGFKTSSKMDKKLLPADLSFSASQHDIVITRVGDDYLSKLSGIMVSDTILSIENTTLNTENFSERIKIFSTKKIDDKIEILIARKGSPRSNPVKLSPSLNYYNTRYTFSISENPKASAAQIEMRKSILHF